MKKRLGSVVAMGFVGLSALGCAGNQEAMMSPTFVLATPVVTIARGGKVTMYGTGFAPKQELILLLTDAGGGMSSIAPSVKPAPVPNKAGAWAVEWDFSSYVKILKPGTGMITVADKDYRTLGMAPIVFKAAPKKPKPEARR